MKTVDLPGCAFLGVCRSATERNRVRNGPGASGGAHGGILLRSGRLGTRAGTRVRNGPGADRPAAGARAARGQTGGRTVIDRPLVLPLVLSPT